MIDVPKWRYGLILVVTLLGLLYATPNLFPQDPAIQISANRGFSLDLVLQERVAGALQGRGIETKAIELGEQRLLIRFDDPETRSRALEALREELTRGYTIALNQASTVPRFFSWFVATPMTLGLDLRGGVHFLMEVDAQAAKATMEERFTNDITSVLREAQLRPRGVTRGPDGITVVLRSQEDRARALDVLMRQIPELTYVDAPVGEERFPLIARITEEFQTESIANALEQNIATLRNRINALGVAEPSITQQGATRIVVQLPGVEDTALAKRILGATATLEYRAVVGDAMRAFEAAQTGNVPAEARLYYTRDGTPVLLSRRVIVGGDQLVNASAGFSPTDGTPAVNVELNSVGARRMLDFTNENVGRGMAVVFIERTPEVRVTESGETVRSTRVTEEVISIATVREPFGRRFQTSGLSSSAEAAELALFLRAGSLAAPVDIVEERTIGPSLGRENIQSGTRAIAAGFVLVMLFMVIYYKMFGLVANIALIVNLVLIVALLSILGATLTMPGIAGILLTIGMAVDANVLIFERIREELRNGSSPLASIKGGYEKAWSTIADANVTTLLAGLALFAFGSGPIRGFAVTLCIGILTSMFTAVVVSRGIVSLIYGGRKLKTLSI